MRYSLSLIGSYWHCERVCQ